VRERRPADRVIAVTAVDACVLFVWLSLSEHLFLSFPSFSFSFSFRSFLFLSFIFRREFSCRTLCASSGFSALSGNPFPTPLLPLNCGERRSAQREVSPDQHRNFGSLRSANPSFTMRRGFSFQIYWLPTYPTARQPYTNAPRQILKQLSKSS
jgi:hypothetical protein